MKREKTSFDDLVAEVLANPDSRAAYIENGLRREMAEKFENSRKIRGWSVGDLTEKMRCSKAQVRRLRHKEQGGSLTLRTLVRAADALGLEISIQITRRIHE